MDNAAAATALHWLSFATAIGASVLGFLAWRRLRAADPIDADPDADAGQGFLRTTVGPLATRIRPTSQADLEQLTTQLLHAGRRSRDAVDRFCEEKILFIFGGMAFAVLNAALIGGRLGFVIAMASLVLGIIGPSKLLELRAQERRDLIATALPGAIDLLTTCIEAGLSLEQSVARVARELRLSAPLFAEELQLTASEFDAGVALPDALRRLARRVGLDDLSALCGVIAQAHGLGAPIAATLREFAESSRKQRMSLLEERAGKLATQLTVPLAMCLLPAALLVILGPAAMQLVRALH